MCLPQICGKVALMRRATAKERLADYILGRPLADFVAERRADGAAWQHISRSLRDATDGAVEISRESLREWFGDDEAVSA